MNPICLVRTLWRSFLAGALVMGHNYRTHPDKTPPNVHVLLCDTCGHTSMAWSWGSMEHLK